MDDALYVQYCPLGMLFTYCFPTLQLEFISTRATFPPYCLPKVVVGQDYASRYRTLPSLPSNHVDILILIIRTRLSAFASVIS